MENEAEDEHSEADDAPERRSGESEAADQVQKPDGESESSEAGSHDDEGLDLTTNQVQRDAESVFDTETENVFPESVDPATPSLGDWSSVGTGTGAGSGSSSGDGGVNLEAFVAEEISLQDHLMAQLPLTISDPVKRLIGDHLIDMVDEDGYMRGDLDNLAGRLGAPVELIEETLATLQSFEPAGVFARDLAECLTLQLKDRNRFDPAIETLIANLALIAAHDLAGLKRACEVRII